MQSDWTKRYWERKENVAKHGIPHPRKFSMKKFLEQLARRFGSFGGHTEPGTNNLVILLHVRINFQRRGFTLYHGKTKVTQCGVNALDEAFVYVLDYCRSSTLPMAQTMVEYYDGKAEIGRG